MGLLLGLQSNMAAYSLILVLALAVNGGLAKPMAMAYTEEEVFPPQTIDVDEVLTLEEIQYMKDILSKQGLQEVEEVSKEEVLWLDEIYNKIEIPDYIAKKFLANREDAEGEDGKYDGLVVINKMEVLTKKMVKKLQEIKSLEEVISRLTVKKMEALTKLEEVLRMEEIARIEEATRLEEIKKKEEIKSINEVSGLEEVSRVHPVASLRNVVNIHELTPAEAQQLLRMVRDKKRGRLAY